MQAKMTLPKVSVIIPTYNRADVLVDALDSVRVQTFHDFEIIVVDDGSIDDTAAVVRRLSPQTRYLRIQHSGRPAVARNAGLAVAKGAYVAFLDSDDQWLADKLKRQIEVLEANSRIGLVCSNAFVGNRLLRGVPKLYQTQKQGISGHVLRELLCENSIITSTVLATRGLIESVGGFCEKPELVALEDYDLWLRLACVTEFAFIQDGLTIYNDEPSHSLRGSRLLSVHWQGMLLIMRRVQNLAQRHGMADQAVLQVLRQQTVSYCRLLAKESWRDGKRYRALATIASAGTYQPVAIASWAWRYLRGTAARAFRQRPLPVAAHYSDRVTGGQDKLRLHLGCGEVYLPGYLNIDYPLENHTVQLATRADLYADITQLEFDAGTVQVVRLHHVFEHFDRATALKLLVTWYEWLTDGGRLIIETPDFERSIWAFVLGSPHQRFKTLRHIFGSQEAAWAVHADGWYKSKFKIVLPRLGFGDLAFRHTNWNGTHNIVVTAYKRSPFMRADERQLAAEELLRHCLIDDGASEKRLLGVWLSKLRSPR